MKKLLLKGLLLFSFFSFFEAKSAELNCGDVSTSINAWSSIDQIRQELREMNIPVFEFHFKKNEFPTFDVIEHPDSCVGKSIINNNYVEGSLEIFIGDEKVYESGEYLNKESGVRVKCRGNTSTAQDYIKKKSYKVKLSKKADLLLRDDKDLRDKDWVLLGNGGFKLNFLAGTIAARACGMPWEPAGRHVSVIMNDQYMGTYYLAEAVKGADNRVAISDTGYIIENDPYWWKPDEVFFKSKYLPYLVGWTFKEPDTDEFEANTLQNIQTVVNIFEEALYTGKDIADMIDFESFANWLVAHDILGTIDGLGSNIFVVKENYNPDNIFETKLKMGPLWDFDDSYKSPEESHASIYSIEGFWFRQLLKYDSFKDLYTKKWLKMKNIISKAVLPELEEYLAQNPDLHKARLIDQRRSLMGYSPTTCPDDDFRELSLWFENRVKALDILNGTVGIFDDPSNSGIESIEDSPMASFPEGVYNMMGQKVDPSYKGIVIKVDPSGKVSKVIQR